MTLKTFHIVLDSGTTIYAGFPNKGEAQARAVEHNRERDEAIARGDILYWCRAIGVVGVQLKPRDPQPAKPKRRRNAKQDRVASSHAKAPAGA